MPFLETPLAENGGHDLLENQKCLTCAAANPAGALRLQSTRPAGRVAELWSRHAYEHQPTPEDCHCNYHAAVCARRPVPAVACGVLRSERFVGAALVATAEGIDGRQFHLFGVPRHVRFP